MPLSGWKKEVYSWFFLPPINRQESPAQVAGFFVTADHPLLAGSGQSDPAVLRQWLRFTDQLLGNGSRSLCGINRLIDLTAED